MAFCWTIGPVRGPLKTRRSVCVVSAKRRKDGGKKKAQPEKSEAPGGDEEPIDAAASFDFQGPLAPESYADASEPKSAGRKRRRRSQRKRPEAAEVGADTSAKPMSTQEAAAVSGEISKLTESFLADKRALKEQIEIDPDFVIAQNEAKTEYDLTAAVIGVGAKNKDLGYVLPYLQTGHIVGFLIIFLTANVYYPGFPLTELPETIRETLRKGIFITFFINAVLCLRAYREAKERGQPPLFWTAKVFMLGGLALNELQVNVSKLDERR